MEESESPYRQVPVLCSISVVDLSIIDKYVLLLLFESDFTSDGLASISVSS